MKYHAVHKRLLHQRRFRKVLIASSILAVVIAFIIVPIEKAAPNSTIQNFSDGLWWAIQTITTVGYGDVTPITELGRILGIIMQVLGTVMFGTLVAMIGSSMSRNQEEFYWERLFQRIDQIDEKVDNLERTTKFLVKYDIENDTETFSQVQTIAEKPKVFTKKRVKPLT
jgi:voltage-gated potassium channel